MGVLEITELVLGLVLVGVLAYFAFIWLRRRLIANGKPLMLCALRTSAEPIWRLGLLRFGARQVDWFSMIGPSLRPVESWDRMALTLEAPHVTADLIPVLGESMTASALHEGREYEIAMHSSGLTALRAWMESQPPGLDQARGSQL